MPIVGQGDSLTLRADARNAEGQAADASVIELSILDADGAPLAGFPVTLADDVVHVGLGAYEYVWTCPADQPPGSYSASWQATVAGQPTQPGMEIVVVVLPGAVVTGTLRWLQKPAGYDAVRALLGITVLDLKDDQIELPGFGPFVENNLIMGSISDALTVTDPARLSNLQIASTFGTAAMIAQTYAKGGMVGLAYRSGGGRSSAEWEALVKDLWSWYTVAIESAAVDPQGDNRPYDLTMMRLAGPTRAARRAQPSLSPWNPAIWYWLAGDPMSPPARVG